MAKEAKKFFVVVDGKEVEVSEEVYRAYKQPLWREHKRIERSQKCNLGKKRCDKKCDTCPYSKEGAPLSLDMMFEDGLDVPGGSNLEDMIELKMTIEALHKALDQLAPDDRAIIERFADGESDRQIADELDRPQTTVSYRRKVIIKRLRKEMKGWE
ncbi:MAG: sigma-70 family RNA polymerase sigma factor [Lachnospiraceae bacterium]|jgi:RNA polymerase sigma factor (sigma-70 family)|nr:sigma-70 family RNA polymerase sigma factor [Lachnospiraceae bacterium]MCH4027952.1 sigma-70 family RNA polymerase sigma factor [Lachnospiraceae bacterium]MCH4065796.1 sigma-70 family RNA polymerase sigma factor [Lachnospiraceae bacterium]MCH4111832.1 sigma-70 family RNA polymerase sigma factor [Lachnospiraceae bacterium]MCI1352369.1 sigma-70 family RNA polymerase sigma factor [Lachnospiraceae bacterium]